MEGAVDALEEICVADGMDWNSLKAESLAHFGL